MIHGVLLSVTIILTFADGGQTTQQFTYQFTGPTAIEACQNAQQRLNATNSAGIMVVHAYCYPD
jgi:hypothetical protein